MFPAATLCYALILAAPPAIETKFEQVAPVPAKVGAVEPTPNQTRAVVLIHGYRPYRDDAAVSHADFRPWQQPKSLLVSELAKDSDVFSFGYGQTTAVSDVVAAGGLTDAVGRLRKAGYKSIVLVGHSAGGLVARQFVEDHPDAGVNKVVQACPPNGGTTLAGLELLKAQRPFLDSLTPEGRDKCLKERAGKKIPDGVQFVCILSNLGGDNDGLVRCDCQWSADLQAQGIPVVAIKVLHPLVPRDRKGVDAIAAAVLQDQPRWKPERVREMREQLFKK